MTELKDVLRSAQRDFTIRYRACNLISLNEAVLDSPRRLYPGFDQWWMRKCVAGNRGAQVALLPSGEIIAIAVLDLRGNSTTKLCTFCVSEQYRHIGLGTHMMRSIKSSLRPLRPHSIYGTVLPEQTRVQSFFRANGFSDRRTPGKFEFNL